MRRAVLVVNLLLVALLAAAPARADIETISHQAGELRISWHGDTAHGCAAAGVCDVRGTLTTHSRPGQETVSTSGTISFGSISDRAPAPPDLGSLEVSADSATVRVRRATGTCAEPLDVFASVFSIEPATPGGYTVALAGGGLSSGRCAGPSAADLAALSIPGRLLGSPARGATLDLRAVSASIAGPYAVTMTSTLRLHLRTSHLSTTITRGRVPPGSSRGRRARTIRQLELTLEYRMAPARGTVALDYAGEGAPACDVLDSCGAHGTARYALTAGGGALELDAVGRAPRHASLRAALRALRAGRLSVSVGDVSSLSPTAGSLVSRTEQPGAPACTDSVPAPDLGLDAESGRRTLTLTLVGPGGVKGRCPAPFSDDAWPNGMLARARLPLTGAAVMAATLGSSGAFAGPGWTGTRLVTLPVTLRRTGARVRIVRLER